MLEMTGRMGAPLDTAAAPPTFWERNLLLLLLPLLAATAVAIGWVGFMASDDESYYLGALAWVNDPPFAGTDHWTTRFPVVLSLAAAIAMLGAGPAALGATALLWYVAFVAAGTALAHRLAGPKASCIAALLFATLPLAASAGSVVNCDLPEATFLILGMWLLAGRVGEEQTRALPSIAAGLCFGLAVLCRETALLALAGLGPLFLLGRPVQRPALLYAALGGAFVLAGEMAFQAALTGDPLHRYGLAAHHDSSLSRAVNEEGNLLLHPAIDPIFVLLFNNEFALLFWVAAGACVARFHAGLDELQRRRFLIIAALAASSFLLVAVLSTKLVLNPRYFTPVAVAAVIAVAIWLARLRASVRTALLAAMIAANLLMLSLQNPHPRWPANALVIAAADQPRMTIGADREAFRRAALPLEWAGLGNVRAGEGALLLVEEGKSAGRQAIARYPAPPRPIGRVMIMLGLDHFLPEAARRPLLSPGPAMLLVRSDSRPR